MGMRQWSARRLPDDLVVLLTLCELALVGAKGSHGAKNAGKTAAAAARSGSRGGIACWNDGDTFGGVGDFMPFKNPLPDVKKYDPVDHSHNWCAIKQQILRGEVSFQDALRGQNVSLLLANQDTPASVMYDKATRQIMGGLSVEVIEEVSKRTGFSFKHSTAVVDYIDRSKNESDDGWLSWAAMHFDVVDWFTITPERYERGLLFAFPFVDVSPHLVAHLEKKENSIWDRFMACLSPFSLSLWLSTLLIFVLSAIVYGLIEASGGDMPQETPVGRTGQAFFLTIVQFTGAGGFAPKTLAGKLFVLSVSFVAMLLVTGYTATLVGQLIMDKKVVPPIWSVEEAAARSLPVCVRKGSPFFDMMVRHHPDVPLFQVDTDEEKFRGVIRGDCVAAIAGQTRWEFESRMHKFNPGCKLGIIGRNLQDMRGSFVSQATSETCKDLVMDVVTFALHQMFLDGFLFQIKELYISEHQDISCGPAGNVDASREKMLPRHMLGPFMLHAVLSFICIGVAICSGHFGLPGRCSKSQGFAIEEDDSTEGSSSS